MAFEWVVLAYALLTTVYVLCLWSRFPSPWPMLALRVVAVSMTLALWLAYRRWPCRGMMLLRASAQLAMLSQWYPDTYELNRILPNLDHIFASFEQSLFGCQPALTLCQDFPSAWVSETLTMGYVSYFPMIAAVAFFYFLCRQKQFTYAIFIIIGSFFTFYVVFDLLPVAGPQFYYAAVGTDAIAQGNFPDIGLYFLDHREVLPSPGKEDGFFYHLLVDAHNAGERPTAAFPSSHVGISVMLLWLAWESRSRWLLLSLLPFAVLMFFATFYIQAHYVIDAIAGVIAGTMFYWLLRAMAKRFSAKPLGV